MNAYRNDEGQVVLFLDWEEILEQSADCDGVALTLQVDHQQVISCLHTED